MISRSAQLFVGLLCGKCERNGCVKSVSLKLESGCHSFCTVWLLFAQYVSAETAPTYAWL